MVVVVSINWNNCDDGHINRIENVTHCFVSMHCILGPLEEEKRGTDQWINKNNFQIISHLDLLKLKQNPFNWNITTRTHIYLLLSFNFNLCSVLILTYSLSRSLAPQSMPNGSLQPDASQPQCVCVCAPTSAAIRLCYTFHHGHVSCYMSSLFIDAFVYIIPIWLQMYAGYWLLADRKSLGDSCMFVWVCGQCWLQVMI